MCIAMRTPQRQSSRLDGQGPVKARANARALPVTALKPFTYSTMHLVVAVTVAYALTQDWRVALGVGLIEPLVQTFAYMAHERIWDRVMRRGARIAPTEDLKPTGPSGAF